MSWHMRGQGRWATVVAAITIMTSFGCVRNGPSYGYPDGGGGDSPSGSDASGGDGGGDGGGDAIVDTGLDPEPLRNGPFKILFDSSHDENAGNANWIIDDNAPNPQPASPASAESWNGAISSWGYELWATGRYTVATLPASGRVTFNDSSNAQDLSKFDAFIVPEPNSPFTAAEKNAILDFVNAGGGLFMVGDHGGSDRNQDGWDSCEVWNDLMTTNDRQANPFGVHLQGNTFTEGPITNLANLPDNRVLHGPFGDVTALSIHAGSSLTITAGHPTVRGLIWRNGFPQGTNYVDFATSKYGTGRVAVIGDTSPADDGTGASGKDLFDGWGEAGVTDDILFLNATGWLVRDSGS